MSRLFFRGYVSQGITPPASRGERLTGSKGGEVMKIGAWRAGSRVFAKGSGTAGSSPPAPHGERRTARMRGAEGVCLTFHKVGRFEGKLLLKTPLPPRNSGRLGRAEVTSPP